MQLSITSAGGVLSLLDENTEKGPVYALHRLNAIVDVFWPEISDSISKVESLYEYENFKHRELAALVSSKVYYHLGSLDNALTYALGAGRLFDVNDKTEYVETIIAHCIDKYTKLQVEKFQSDGTAQIHIDQRLEDIVNRMFQRCFDDKKYKQAIGIALETRRIDIFEKAIKEANHSPEMLTYALKITMQLLQNRKFRTVVLRILVHLYLNLQVPDFISVCQYLIFLDDPDQVADILQTLVRGTTDQMLMAYQIGFDLYESATQQFLNKIQDALRVQAPIPITFDKQQGIIKDEQQGGEITIGVHMQFLIKNNHADLLILKQIKDAVRNSVCHTATVIANGYMLSGTTSDQFFRDNLEWLARATNWAKFTAATSLGVIHKGHIKEALNLMSAYLPKDSTGNSSYAEGGGLYALGLIHANHGGDIIDYLINQLRSNSTQTDAVRHGACLGLGLAAMGTARSDVYELLKTNLLLEDTVAGEAAGLAMGFVMLSTGSAQAIEDMVQYAQETQHEKILHGLVIDIVLVQYGRLEEADALIEQLQRDKDPILRRSAMYTVAMAYCGTGNSAAVRKLLHVAVSDVNDDVRRSTVKSLGFLMFCIDEQMKNIDRFDALYDDLRAEQRDLKKKLEQKLKQKNERHHIFWHQKQNKLIHVSEGIRDFNERIQEYIGLLACLPLILNIQRSGSEFMRNLQHRSLSTISDFNSVVNRNQVLNHVVLAEINFFQKEKVKDFNLYMKILMNEQIQFYEKITSELHEAAVTFN
ncbi:unnamed protein product [Rotaria sordida]|uniref:26S proteasome non-ATPase regulatory subunit 1 n=1 Tax=Rotaria sordida TaxID=392033 RepID=A0A814WCG0_9BILA|nr:unnamed protein product [Rotaria sordida]